MERFTSYVDGQFEAARGEGVAVVNPSDFTDVLGQWHPLDAADAPRVARVAERAFSAWNAMSPVERGQMLFRAADLLERQAEDLARWASREMGKPIGEMRGEVARGVALLRYYGGEGMRAFGDVIPSAQADALLFTQRNGVGPVLLITPWNFPVAIPLWKMAPALVFGNSVIWKPAEQATATAVRLVQILAEAGWPAGVINLVLGRGREIGPVLTRLRPVRAVSFTGSRPVGLTVAQGALENEARFQLEMGGKNPAIVLEDADLEVAAARIASGGYRSAGQKCTATSRVIVVASIRDRFREALEAQIRSIRQAPALDDAGYLGPVVSSAQRASVLDKIERGRQAGARVIVGPEPRPDLPPGAYVAPTLLEQDEPVGVLHADEIFGPVVTLFPARDADDAIRIANSVPYGLSASLFTRDLDRALHYIRHIEAGLVRVNEESAGVEYQAPFGGVKESSYGPREQGRAAIEFYTETRTVTIRPSR
jgi:acyl-CoA reductase-like NAD-dependent aldehyde dehydrogenase